MGSDKSGQSNNKEISNPVKDFECKIQKIKEAKKRIESRIDAMLIIGCTGTLFLTFALVTGLLWFAVGMVVAGAAMGGIAFKNVGDYSKCRREVYPNYNEYLDNPTQKIDMMTKLEIMGRLVKDETNKKLEERAKTLEKLVERKHISKEKNFSYEMPAKRSEHKETTSKDDHGLER